MLVMGMCEGDSPMTYSPTSMADSDARLTNLKAIMQWSLRQSDSGDSTSTPMDPEVSIWSCIRVCHTVYLYVVVSRRGLSVLC